MLEERYQALCCGDPGEDLNKTMLTAVLGDLYDANVLERNGNSVYWKGMASNCMKSVFNMKSISVNLLRYKDGSMDNVGGPSCIAVCMTPYNIYGDPS